MRIRWLMSAGPHTVRYRMGWLAGVTGCLDSLSQNAVNLAERSTVTNTADAVRKNLEKLVEQDVVLRGECAWADIFG